MTSRRRSRLTIELIILAVLVGVALGNAAPMLARGVGAYDFVDPIVDVRREILSTYVEQPDEEQMRVGAIEGMIATLDDPYTNYFTAEQLETFEQHTTGTFSGIGAEIDQRDGYIVVVSPLEDSPAFKAGVRPGDLILEVDGESIQGVSTTEAVQRITGPEGTDVELKVRHPNGEEEVITITRRRIEIETVKGVYRDGNGHWHYMLDPDNRIAWLRMTQFSVPTYDALLSAVEEARAAGMRGMILDLRFNPGGLLDSAVKVSDLFLDDGVIVSTEGRTRPQREWEAEPNGDLGDFPIVVLVNEASASASEIVAGALKHNDRAVVLGTRTVGKGSVQEIHPLEGGDGGIKLTTSYYYLPNGQNIHRRENAERWGVDPSDGFYVALTPEQLDAWVEVRRSGEYERAEAWRDVEVSPTWIEEHLADPQLAAALRTMRAKLKTGAWEEVGPGESTILAHIAEKAELERRRQRYLERVGEIESELARLEQIIRTGEAPQPVDADDTPAPEDVDPNEVPAEKLPESEPEAETEPAQP